MKFITCLAILLAAVSCSQASLLQASIAGRYDEPIPSKGNFVFNIFGKTTNQTLEINSEFVQFEVLTDFPEDFSYATVRYESESKKPFFIYYFLISTDSGEKEMKFEHEKNIESGTYVVFQ